MSPQEARPGSLLNVSLLGGSERQALLSGGQIQFVHNKQPEPPTDTTHRQTGDGDLAQRGTLSQGCAGRQKSLGAKWRRADSNVQEHSLSVDKVLQVSGERIARLGGKCVPWCVEAETSSTP